MLPSQLLEAKVRFILAMGSSALWSLDWDKGNERRGEAFFTEMTKMDIQSVLHRVPDGHATLKISLTSWSLAWSLRERHSADGPGIRKPRRECASLT